MRILGMEFGAWSVKAVEMESRFRRVEILDLHEVKLPLQNTDPVGAYKAAVDQLMARLPSHPEKIVTSLPAAQSALRFLQIPLRSRKKVEQSFKFDLEDSIPFKLEDSIIEHHVNILSDGSLVFAAIAPKKHIQSQLEWLKSIGVEPDWITFDGMGVINLYLAAQATVDKEEEKPTGPVLLLDLGHQKTNLSIISQNRLEMFRSLTWGGATITNAIASELMIPMEEAEQKKIREVRLDETTDVTDTQASTDLISAVTQAFVPFIADLSHALVAYRSLYKTEVTSVMLVGGTAKLQGIDDFISKNLGVPTSFFKPFKGVSLGREIDVSQEMRFGEPLGRAFVFTRKSELLFNFRKEDLAKGTSLTEVSAFMKDPNIIKLGQYAGVLAGVLFAAAIFLGYVAEQEAKRSREELRKVFSDTFHSVPTKLKTSLTNDPKELKKYLDIKNNELNQKLKMLSKERVPMMGLLREISDCFPADVKVDVNSVTLDDRSMRVEGVLYSGNIERVTAIMKGLPNFKNVALEQNGQRFAFKGEIVGR